MRAVELLSEAVGFIFTKTPLTDAFIIHNPLHAKIEKTFQSLPKSIAIGQNEKFYPSDTSLTARVNDRLLKIDDGKAIDVNNGSPRTLIIFPGVHKELIRDGDNVTLGDTGVEVIHVSSTVKSSQGALTLLERKLEEKVKAIPSGLYVVGWSCDVCGWKTPIKEGIVQRTKGISVGFLVPDGVKKKHAKIHMQNGDQYLTFLAHPYSVEEDTLERYRSIKFTGKVKV